MRRRLGSVAAALALALALALTAQTASAQEPPAEHPVFGHTLLYGSGFINTPHAFVPSKTTIFGSATAVLPEDASGNIEGHTIGTAGLALLKFLEAGVTFYDVNKFGLFGKLQVMRQQRAFPAMAVGLWNLTTESRGRFGVEDPFYAQLKDAASFYGAFTYVVGPGGQNFNTWLVFTGGWGTGLFLENNPAVDPDGRSGGVFGSVAIDIQASDDAYFRFVFEHDGFDKNVAMQVNLVGLEVSVGVLAINAGDAPPPLAPGAAADPLRQGVGVFYNQAKPFLSIAADIRALGAWPWIWGSDEK